MYKLLTTAAVIMAVATPSIANQWTDGQKLTQDLETIYTNLDGNDGAGSHFQNLQGQNGELNLFFNEVDKGVTHLTLSVDADTHAISAVVNGGSSFTEIKATADNLVNRINYDLFVETGETTYDVNGGYATPNAHTIDGTPADKGNNDYLNSQTAGLLGVKTTELVGNVNTINDGLLSETLTTDARQNFIDEYAAVGTGEDDFNGVSIAGFKATLGELNTAISTASDGGFFSNIADITDPTKDGFTADTVNNFIIPSYVAHNDIGEIGAGYYTSISAWANGIQSVQVDAGVGTVTAAGEVVIVDAAAGTITVGGNPYTYNAGVFTAG